MANPYEGDSLTTTPAGLTGRNTAPSGNGIGVLGTSANGEVVHGETSSTQFAAVAGIELNASSNIAAVYGEQRGNGPGVYGIAKGHGHGVFGGSASGEGVHGETNSTQYAAVAGRTLNPSGTGAGVYGQSLGHGDGVFGSSATSNGVSGTSGTGTGVSGTGGDFGVSGEGAGVGVSGSSKNIGVAGHGTATGVFGTVYAPNYTGQVYLTTLPPVPQLSGTGGVIGLGQGEKQFGTIGLSTGANGVGVLGITTGHGGVGVTGQDYIAVATGDQSGGTGVLGTTDWGVGVYGICNNVDKSKGWAGRFDGNVQINGTLFKSAGGFMIDHPLEPKKKYLCHSFVESPEMLNVYSGTVTLDSVGEALVPLPKWFEALNSDFRYQLTCVGAFAPVYIGQEVKGGTFKIAGGNPEMKVCWQVTGVRCDAYAQQNRVPVEMEKPKNNSTASTNSY